PIARGLIGKMEGDEVTISTPGGEKVFEIDRVYYL
ncbi:GreA/GreB family elongation factor, partial [Vibrio parahaemolyticus]|nr:GreA/GreB family elongation factor [Vibrio parahaemolyticus]